jgi:hypothetical protein
MFVCAQNSNKNSLVLACAQDRQAALRNPERYAFHALDPALWWGAFSGTASSIPEKRHFIVGYLQHLVDSLKEEKTELRLAAKCTQKMNNVWVWPTFCNATQQESALELLVFDALPHAYRALRQAMALAYPPDSDRHPWNFDEQVNVKLLSLREWPLTATDREPLSDGSQHTNIELQSARMEFYAFWIQLIDAYYLKLTDEIAVSKAHIDQGFKWELPILNWKKSYARQFKAALEAADPETTATMAAQISDPEWQRYYKKQWIKYRLKQQRMLLAILDHDRSLGFLTKAMPTPDDLHEVFSQQIPVNEYEIQKVTADRESLANETGSFSRSSFETIYSYINFHEDLERYLTLHPEQCDAATALWAQSTERAVSAGLAEATEVLAGSFVVPAWAASIGFLGLTYQYTHSQERIYHDQLDLFDSSLTGDNNFVSAETVFTASHDAKMSYLAYPLLFAGVLAVEAPLLLRATSQGLIRLRMLTASGRVRVLVSTIGKDARVAWGAPSTP